MESNFQQFPRKIWFLWLQGYENAPLIVKKCWKTWITNNPNWEVIFLSEDNLHNYVKLDLKDARLSHQRKNSQANLIRLKLLSEYGGVWVDATCFCVQPLDNWLGNYLDSSFFAFSNPGKDRLMSNWFLASNQDNPIVSKLYDELFSYLTSPNYRYENKTLLMRTLKKIMCRSTKSTKYWFHPLFTKVLKLYPHYIFHYLFTELVSNDYECKDIWDRTPKLSADIPHKMMKIMHEPLPREIKHDIDSKTDFVYKLNWKKYNQQPVKTQSTIHYLLQTV